MGYTSSGGTKGRGSFNNTPATTSDLNQLLALINAYGNGMVITETERDALSGDELYAGLVVYNTTAGAIEVYDGSGWRTVFYESFSHRTKAAAQSVPNATWTTITWPTTESEANMAYSSGVFTVPAAGRYLVQAAVAFASGGSTGQRTVRLRSSAGMIRQSPQVIPNAAYAGIPTIATTVDLDASDTIYIEGYQSQGSAVNAGVGADQSYITITRLT